MARYLVYSSIGDYSNIQDWLQPGRNFDVWLTYYGNGECAFRDQADAYYERKGSKFQNFKHLAVQYRQELSRYEAILLLDDDIQISASDINTLFNLRKKYNLTVLQPSFLGSGKISFPATICYPGSPGRYTNFVEVNCPLFNAADLLRFMDVYDGSLTGWGIDWWYMEFLCADIEKSAAIIDQVTCRNPFESEKGVPVREIDRLQPLVERQRAWTIRKSQLGLRLEEQGLRISDLIEEKSAPAEHIKPYASIIIELENMTLADSARTSALFSRLSAQISSLDKEVEVLVIYDPDCASEEQLHELAALAGNGAVANIGWTFIKARGKHYYALKNEAVLQAAGEYIVFADSDIIPDENWLRHHIEFTEQNPDFGMAGGSTYITPDGIIGKAFAAGWFFPLPETGGQVLEPAPFVWANNCIFRRNVFLAHPYREAENGETRGACYHQLQELLRSNVRTCINTRARVSHAAPYGIRHFMVRALAEARDQVIGNVRKAPLKQRIRALNPSWRFARMRLAQTIKRLSTHEQRSRIGVTRAEAPLAFAIMAIYYTIYMAGAGVACILPEWSSRQWRI